MLRDNLVELIEPMRNSAGAGLLALGICQQKPASDDSLSCLENPRPEGAESSLTDYVTSPFPAEPRHYLEEIRKIRNDVMHFDPEGIAPEDMKKLRSMVVFMRQLPGLGNK